jgi:hypothetical protein
MLCVEAVAAITPRRSCWNDDRREVGSIRSPLPFHRPSLIQGTTDRRHPLHFAVDPMSRVSVCQAPSRLGPGDLVGLGRPRQAEGKSGIGSPAKTASYYRHRVPRAQVLGNNCIVLNPASPPPAVVTSGVNGVLKRKLVSPQWDRSARSSNRQHRRCIGCGKTLLSFWAFSWLLIAYRILCRVLLSGALKHNVARSGLRADTGRRAEVSRFV